MNLIHDLGLIDYGMLHDATQWAASQFWSRSAAYFGAEWLILLIPVTLYLLWRHPDSQVRRHGPQKAVVIATVAVVITLALKTLITLMYIRERPFITHPDLLAMTLRGVDPESFPSGHAMIAFAAATSVWLSGYRRVGVFLFLLALIVAISRVLVGVHYPSDVLAGAVLGWLCAWYLHREASSLKRYLPNH
jgi:undecaprenyl-diphosphatase